MGSLNNGQSISQDSKTTKHIGPHIEVSNTKTDSVEGTKSLETPNYNPRLPVGIEDCAIWMDAADNDTIVKSDGKITLWTDKSSNGLAFAPILRRHGPTLSNINGVQAVNFYQPNIEFLQNTSIPTGLFIRNEYECFIMYQATKKQGQVSSVFCGGSSVGGIQRGFILEFVNLSGLDYINHHIYVDYANAIDDDYEDSIINIAGLTTDIEIQYTPTKTPRIMRFRTTGSPNANSADFQINETVYPVTPHATPFVFTNTFDVLTIGGGGLNSGSTCPYYLFNGNIGEIVIYNRSLTTEERTSVYTYLKTKWGLIW